MKCPNCGAKNRDDANTCYLCNCNFAAFHQKKQMEYQRYQQELMEYQQANQQQQVNPNLMVCPACHNWMSKIAESCPYCGNPRPRKVANPVVLDIFSLMAIFVALDSYRRDAINTIISFIIMVTVLIIYMVYYLKIKDNPDIDSRKVKISFITVAILFILMFCVGFVIIITFK